MQVFFFPFTHNHELVPSPKQVSAASDQKFCLGSSKPSPVPCPDLAAVWILMLTTLYHQTPPSVTFCFTAAVPYADAAHCASGRGFFSVLKTWQSHFLSPCLSLSQTRLRNNSSHKMLGEPHMMLHQRRCYCYFQSACTHRMDDNVEMLCCRAVFSSPPYLPSFQTSTGLTQAVMPA